jgi:peptide/nickel transport system substrate-binding protein
MTRGAARHREQGPRGIGRREFLAGTGAGLGAAALGLAAGGCATGAGGRSGELAVAMSDAIVTLDPTDHFSTATTSVLRHIYDPLLDADNVSRLVPALALSWSPVDDRSWRFVLRQGVTFHDGSPFNADSVVYTIDRVRTTRSLVLADTFHDVAAVRKEGDHAVVVTSRGPDAALPSKLTLLGILPASAAGREDAFFRNPVGTGPYRFVRWIPGDRVELAGRTGYWVTGWPRVPRVTFRFVPDAGERLALLRRGEVDIYDRAAPEDVATLARTATLRVVATPSIEVPRWHFNLGRAPWSDVRMRRAVSLGIDRARLIRDFLGETGNPAVSPLPPTLLGHVAQPVKPHDPERARALLREAGQPSPTLEWVQFQDRYPKQREISAAVRESLGAVGIAVTVRALPNAEALADRREGRYDLFYSLWSHTTHDPDWYLSLWYTKAGAANLTRFDDPRVEALVLAARTGDPQARAGRYAEIQRILWEQEHEIWPFYLHTHYGISDRLFNFTARRDGAVLLAGVGLAR